MDLSVLEQCTVKKLGLCYSEVNGCIFEIVS